MYGTFSSSAGASALTETISGVSGPLGEVSINVSAVTRNLIGSPANVTKVRNEITFSQKF
jgi:hypothetical protein